MLCERKHLENGIADEKKNDGGEPQDRRDALAGGEAQAGLFQAGASQRRRVRRQERFLIETPQ